MDPAASSSLPSPEDDLRWMQLAYAEAELAAEEGEVPVGAVIVSGGRILGRGHNRTEALQDPTAHAEILAITAAANTLVSWRIEGSSLYVTLEPCTMCAGAMVHARIAQLVFAATEPRAGVACSRCRLLDEPWYNHRVSWQGGVLAEASGEKLQAFFRSRR